MTIGISKERLKEKFEGIYWKNSSCDKVLESLLNECTELNPWLPIEQAPKDRFLLMYSSDIEGISKKFVGKAESCWHWKPTHFCELPADPK